MLAFTVGAILPLLTITFSPASARIIVTVLSVAAALALTGLGERAPRPQPRAAGRSCATSPAACSPWA